MCYFTAVAETLLMLVFIHNNLYFYSESDKQIIRNLQGPNGTPSMLSQPVYSAYEYDNLQSGFSTAEQHELARQV